jgi:predicted amidohydrolase
MKHALPPPSRCVTSLAGFLAAWVAFTGLLAGRESGDRNLLSEADRTKGAPPVWTAWAPSDRVRPSLDGSGASEGGLLRIQSARWPDYGYWRTSVGGIQPGRFYRFSVRYRTRAVEREDVSVFAVLSWCGDSGAREPLQRDYARRAIGPDGRRLEHELRAPDNAVSLRIELGLRWTEGGSVEFFAPELREVRAGIPRRVRVATTRVRPPVPSTVAGNLEILSRVLDSAGALQPDVILLSETLFDYGVPEPVDLRCARESGPELGLLAAKARQYRSYVVASLNVCEADLVYNSTYLFDRDGRMSGVYRKVHLPLSEAEAGVTPGRDYAVFDTDFGRVGLLVCWDVWFPEPARLLRLAGAEVILAPLAGDVVPRHWDVVSRARAVDNAVYFVSANTEVGSASRIVDPDGEVLAETSEDFGIAVAELELDKRRGVRWLSVGDAEGDPSQLYLKERRPETYRRLTADPKEP